MPVNSSTPVTVRVEPGSLVEKIIIPAAMAILLVSAVIWADQPPLMEKTDFSVTYIGSRMVHLGIGAKLYDLGEQQKIRAALLPHAERLVYEHPPFEAWLLAPLGGLSYRSAYLIWGLFNVTIWLALPGLFRPYAPAPSDNLGYMVLWLLFAPLGIALFQGQSSLLLLLLYAAAFIQLKRGREEAAGVLLGLGLFKFQMVLPFVLIFVLRRKWRFVRGFAFSAAVLGAVSLIAVGPTGVLGYIKLLTAVGSQPANVSYGSATDMATLQGFVHAVFGSIVNGKLLGAAVAAISLLIVSLTAWYWGQIERDSSGFDCMFSLAIVVTLVTSFHMFTHDMSPLLLAMFLVIPQISLQHSPGLRAALRITLIVLWIPFIYFLLVGRHCMYLFFPVLLLFGILILLVEWQTIMPNLATEAGARCP